MAEEAVAVCRRCGVTTATSTYSYTQVHWNFMLALVALIKASSFDNILTTAMRIDHEVRAFMVLHSGLMYVCSGVSFLS